MLSVRCRFDAAVSALSITHVSAVNAGYELDASKVEPCRRLHAELDSLFHADRTLMNPLTTKRVLQ